MHIIRNAAWKRTAWAFAALLALPAASFSCPQGKTGANRDTGSQVRLIDEDEHERHGGGYWTDEDAPRRYWRHHRHHRDRDDQGYWEYHPRGEERREHHDEDV